MTSMLCPLCGSTLLRGKSLIKKSSSPQEPGSSVYLEFTPDNPKRNKRTFLDKQEVVESYKCCDCSILVITDNHWSEEV